MINKKLIGKMIKISAQLSPVQNIDPATKMLIGALVGGALMGANEYSKDDNRQVPNRVLSKIMEGSLYGLGLSGAHSMLVNT